MSYERFETFSASKTERKISSTKNVLLEAESGLTDTENESSQIDAEIFFLFIFYIRVHSLHLELFVAGGKVYDIHVAVVAVRLYCA